MWILARLHGETQDAWFLRKVGASNHRCEAPLGSLKLHFQEGFLDGLSLWVKQNETVNWSEHRIYLGSRKLAEASAWTCPFLANASVGHALQKKHQQSPRSRAGSHLPGDLT